MELVGGSALLTTDAAEVAAPGWCTLIFSSALIGTVIPWLIVHRDTFRYVLSRSLNAPLAAFQFFFSQYEDEDDDRLSYSTAADNASSHHNADRTSSVCPNEDRFFFSSWGLPHSHPCQHGNSEAFGEASSAALSGLRSKLLSFSAGVCLAVAFTMEANGLRIIQKSSSFVGTESAMFVGCSVVAVSVILFFTIEQMGLLLHSVYMGFREEPSGGGCSHQHVADGGYHRAPSDISEGDIVTTTTQQPHIHPPTTHTESYSYIVLATVYLIFSIHSISEGMGLGVALASPESSYAVSIGSGILLHKGLSAFALGSAMLSVKFPALLYFGMACVFASLTPLGVLLAQVLGKSSTNPLLGGIFSLVSSGTFIHISLVEFIPQAFDCSSHIHVQKERILRLLLFILGNVSVFLLSKY